MVADNRVLVADARAERAGVVPGTGVAAARLLAPDIVLLARETAREAAALHALACWAGRFTPKISLSDDTLLLEVGRCLRLFGGLAALTERVRTEIAGFDHTVCLAAAPTPRAAQWLAQAGEGETSGDDPAGWRARLDALPLSVLPASAARLLSRIGARTLGGVRRLPAAALGRRIGRETPLFLAQAYGECADLRQEFHFPERFAQSLTLPGVVEYASALLFAARRLVLALSGWLSARQAGVRECVLHLLHERADTPMTLRFAEPTADGERFERVLRERLDRLTLEAPVESLRLEATEVVPLAPAHRTLFDTPGSGEQSIGALCERLAARLGDGQLFRLAERDEHRPECATQPLAADTARVAPAPVSPVCHPRPLWLLDPPMALREADGRPYWRGPLILLAGPERIESGWWDHGEAPGRCDIRRDYFVAQSGDRRGLWIFRDCRAPWGWFLQGFFS